jgi:ADP-ribose pyrophosphatase
MAFETIDSETVFKGKVFNVRRDRVSLPDGKQTDIDVVEHRGAVTLLPIDEQGRVWLVRQYRHPAKSELLELPAGVINKDETPEVCARREIREEIGMSAGQLLKLGEFFMAPGYSTEYMHVFLATDLNPDPLKADEDEFLSIEKIPLAQLYQMAEQGEIRDSKTLAVLFLARRQAGAHLPGSTVLS